MWTFGATSPNKTLSQVSSGSSTFNHPTGIGLDIYQNLYVCNHDNGRVVMFRPNSTSGIVVIDGATSSPQVSQPTDVAIDSQLNMYVAVRAHKVIKFPLS